MFETDAELADMQALLDASLSRATEHLQSIITPGERTLTAAQLSLACRGMCTLAISTVTAACEPRVSAVDGHLLHGRWYFSTARGAAKARHLAARPAVSIAYLRGEEIGVFTHGTAQPMNPAGGADDPDWPPLLQYMTDYYGSSPLTWGDVVYYRLAPTWMVAFASNPAELMANLAPAS
ncbi:MAG TPA: pyridoxamine 5'-phosphate oxidase family protein [Streptosporangiaceae bacterium]|nr:pyridoxamine 5'-phosphate oxidase family protein [Streptosporangiaceae bacterium]